MAPSSGNGSISTGSVVSTEKKGILRSLSFQVKDFLRDSR